MQTQAGSVDGQDWPISQQNCEIEEEITGIKELYGFTLRNNECFRSGATSFSDFDSNKLAALWEIIFQQFVYLCEAAKKRLRMIVNGINGEIRESEILRYYVEAILDKKKFADDVCGNYTMTGCVGYTFWMVIMDSQNEEVVFDIEDIYSGILKSAHEYCDQITGGNSEMIDTILKKIFEKDDDTSAKQSSREERAKKRQRRQDHNTLKNLKRHERWKLLANKEMLTNIFDIMMQHQEWQSVRVDDMIQSRKNLDDSPELASIMFNPFTAFYSRYPRCVYPQSVYAIDNAIRRDPHSGLWTIRFPMRKYVMKIPPSIVSVESFVGRKLLDYQLNSSYSMSKSVPVLLADIESKILIERRGRENHKRREKTLHGPWEKNYKKYKQIIKHVAEAAGVDSNDGDSDISTPMSDSLLDDELDSFKLAAINMAASGILRGNSEMMFRQTLCELERMENMDELNALSEVFHNTKALSALVSRSKIYGMHGLLTDVVKKNGGRFVTLLQSQLVNCTTIWPEGTDTRDKLKDEEFSKYVSVYAMLSAQNVASRMAIETIEKGIELGTCVGGSIKNITEVKRKLLIMLKRHLLKSYEMKCLSPDAYGISPYEKAFLRFHKKGFSLGSKIYHRNIDDTLGIFENSEIGFYARLKVVMQNAENQRSISIALKALLDSTRASNDMHYNVIFMGAAHATGKSTITDIVSEMAIEGTCVSNVYNSPRSDLTAERNLNGGTIIMPEISFSALDDRDPKNAFGQRQKNLLTSCVSAGVRLQFDDTEKIYKAVHFRSEQQGSVIGNGNWNVRGRVSGPVASRFHFVEINEGKNTQDNVLHAKTLEKLFAGKLSPEQERFRDENRVRQLLEFHIERGILVGFLDQVTTDIGWIFCMVLQRILKSRGISMGSVRTAERIIIIARRNCIYEAEERTWFHSGAKFNGRTIRMEQFEELDRKLFLTTNHITAAIGECYDNIINPIGDYVKNAIYDMFCRTGINSRFRRRSKRIVNNSTGEDFDFMYQDYNYIRFGLYPGDALKHLSAQIVMVIKSTSGTEVNRESVETVIKAWANCVRQTRNYYRHGDKNAKPELSPSGRAELEANQKDILPDMEEPLVSRHLVEIGNDCVYFLYQHFGEQRAPDSIDILRSSVLEILASANQMHGKYLFDTDKDFPFIRDVIKVDSNSSSLISMKSLALAKTELKRVIGYSERPGSFRDMTEELWDADGRLDYCSDSSLESGDGSADVTSIAYDLNALSAKRRNETLCITGKKIGGDFERYDIFTGKIKRPIEAYLLNEYERDALAFSSNTDYDETEGGYFMGRSLSDIKKSEGIFDSDEMEKKLKRYYQILDDVDVGDDQDFIVQDYSLPDLLTMEADLLKKNHWESLPVPMRKEEYKLVREHPRIADDFFKQKSFYMTDRTSTYPETIKLEYTKSNKNVEKLLDDLKIADGKKIVKGVEEGTLKVIGYNVKTGFKPSVEIDSNDPYHMVVKALTPKKYTGTINLSTTVENSTTCDEAGVSETEPDDFVLSPAQSDDEGEGGNYEVEDCDQVLVEDDELSLDTVIPKDTKRKKPYAKKKYPKKRGRRSK